MTTHPVAIRDTGVRLHPDPARAIARFFVPGNEDSGPGDSRAAAVIGRVLDLTDAEVATAMHDVDGRFGDRHRSVYETYDAHAALVGHGPDEPVAMSTARRRLVGAAFTHEYSIEGAALCNPSIVAHPEQSPGDDRRIVLSVRGIGEGHRSSIGFRTGTVTATGEVSIDPPGPFPAMGRVVPGIHHRAVLHRKLADLGDDHENAAFVLDQLPEVLDDEQLHGRLAALRADAATRRHTPMTIAHLDRLARGSYRVEFPADSEVSERVLWPQAPAESHGMEDARFVEITDGSAPRFCATYTAYDGADISQHLITTEDFLTFAMTPMGGRAARGKGLALFPRLVGGRHVALSRADRETNSIASSDDLRCWDSSRTIQTPHRSWEVLQLGNCGSPIETSAGWLVLTHGVGPMRTYSLGAVLLDLDEPEHVVAVADEPLLRPGREHRTGYVPNVLYSCGGLAIGDLLVLPYGIGDQVIRIATLSIAELIAGMRRTTHA